MPVRVLVVDDSIFMRELISGVLNADPGIRVIETARDGPDALRKILSLRPDCITLDLTMPGWTGLVTLEHIMSKCPTPVVILSAHSKQHADITVQCLSAGAVSFVLKPSGELSLDIEKVGDQLISQVKVAARAEVRQIKASVEATADGAFAGPPVRSGIVVIGASTGGPPTLRAVLSSMAVNLPVPVVVAQHMPAPCFTESLARQLDNVCRIQVKTAVDKEEIKAGTVYLAPGGSRMTLRGGGAQQDIRLKEFGESEWVSIHLTEAGTDAASPSIDRLMKSASRLYGAGTIGVVLSGIGKDGLEGMRSIKSVGGDTIVQDESSVVFGMPKAVITAGLADQVLDAAGIAGAITRVLGRDSKRDGRRRNEAEHGAIQGCVSH